MEILEKWLPINKWTRPGREMEKVKAIVVHYTGLAGGSNESLWKYLATCERYSGCHYGIGIEGGVMAMVPEHEITYHVGSDKIDPASGRVYTDYARAVFGDKVCSGGVITPNFFTIGIEVNFPAQSGKFSAAGANSLVKLLRVLQHRYPWADICTHKDIVGWKDCPWWYVKHPQDMALLKWAVKNDYIFKEA
jgi:N-acetylmuramoyl-L-alanine amidase